MKVCIVGVGAIGGFIGTKLALAGNAQVSAFARGATLDALQSHGWRMRSSAGEFQAHAHASSNATELGLQDLVIVAVKGHALASVARSIGPLLSPRTVVLPAMNGVPWWFCSALPGFEKSPLRSVDPTGEIAQAISIGRVLGCVVHGSSAVAEPGVVQHKTGQGLIVGEPQGGLSTRAQLVVDLLADAGFDAKQSQNVRQDIWYKLWGNLTMNPVSAMTGATVDRVLGDPLVREFCSQAMQEAADLGSRIGCPIDQSAEDRHAITAKLGAFKTSMLQDVEAHRELELDAIVGAVVEIGQRLGHRLPHIEALFGLTRLFARTHGLYGGGEARQS